MNRDSYAGLQDDLRAVIDANSGAETSAWAGRAHDIGDTEGLDLMAASGNQIATLGQAETDEIKALGDAVIQEWIADANAKGLDGQLLVDDARSALAGTLN